MNEKLKALFDGTELSEEFITKVQDILESEVTERVETKAVQIEEEVESKYEKLSTEYAEYVVEEAEQKAQQYLDEEVMPMVEKYLDYATEEFIKENKPELDSKVKVELAESFLTGMAGIAESFNVKVPEGKDDYITEMEEKFAKLQKRFDSVLDEKTELEGQIVESKKSAIVEDKVKNLTETQKEKILKVSEKVKYKDDDQFTAAMIELVESYFPASDERDGDKIINEAQEEQIDEDKNKNKTWAENLLDQI